VHRELISRRSLLHSGATLLLPISAGRAAEQVVTGGAGKEALGERRVSLIKEIGYAGLLDVSPDSKKLCLYFSKHPVRSFARDGQWGEKKAPVRRGEDALRVIGTDNGFATYTSRLPALPFRASFFADGDALYVEIPGVGAGTDRVLVDLRVGKTEDWIDATGEYLFSFWALDDRTLLGAGSHKTLNRFEVLTKVEAPGYKELARVAFAERRNKPDSSMEAPINVAADRRAFVYAYDSKVVYRRAEDLGMVWTRTGDPELPFWRVGISADGAYVAAAAADTVAIGYSKAHYVSVLSGRDGKELIRVPALGVEDVAISPDGRILAAGQRIPIRGKKSGTQPTVTLYDTASGKEIATVIHDQFYGGGSEFLIAGVKIMFSPDGRYLLTSGLNTKIWRFAAA
jgi:hypothetical protein